MSFLFTRTGGQYTPETGVRAKIIRFGGLPNGWHFGRGSAISLTSIRHALRVLETGDILGLPANAFPGADDEIAVAFHGSSRVVEVVVGPNGLRRIFVEPIGAEEPEVHEAEISTLDELYPTLLELAERPKWRSQGSSIHFISTSRPSGSPTLLSSTPAESMLATVP